MIAKSSLAVLGPVLALVLAGCVASAPPPPPFPPPPPPNPYAASQNPRDAQWLAQNPLPGPEGDLAWIRAYGEHAGFTYAAEWERLMLVNLMHWRVERSGIAGYQRVWPGDGEIVVNVKPPVDEAALRAMAAPEIRDELRIRHTDLDAADVERLQVQLVSIIGTLPPVDSVAGFDTPSSRFKVTIVGQEAADALRAALPEELSRHTDIETAEGPLFVY